MIILTTEMQLKPFNPAEIIIGAKVLAMLVEKGRLVPNFLILGTVSPPVFFSNLFLFATCLSFFT